MYERATCREALDHHPVALGEPLVEPLVERDRRDHGDDRGRHGGGKGEHRDHAELQARTPPARVQRAWTSITASVTTSAITVSTRTPLSTQMIVHWSGVGS